jgi:hypothetical protein
MLCLIPIVGGLLIMMGQHSRSEALFYYFRLGFNLCGAPGQGQVQTEKVD